MKAAHKLELSRFIQWDHGENYPFSACMAKLMELLGGDARLYTYGFFAGLSGDDFVMCYGNNGRCNDCVSVCENTGTFLARTFGRIGLSYRYFPSAEWKKDPGALWEELCAFLDRGIPVLTVGEGAKANYDLVFAYDRPARIFQTTCGDPVYDQAIPLEGAEAGFVFLDALPAVRDLAAVYRESILQIPALMQGRTENGAVFGANAYRSWADDLENGRYDGCTEENFDKWQDWCVYVCNLATNARHGWDFIAKAYWHNQDLPNILHLIALLDRSERDVWYGLEAAGCGFNVTPENLQNPEKRAKAAALLRQAAGFSDEICRLF